MDFDALPREVRDLVNEYGMNVTMAAWKDGQVPLSTVKMVLALYRNTCQSKVAAQGGSSRME